MIALHCLPPITIDNSPVIHALVGDQRPQLLFALLDGISLGIISARGDYASARSEARRSITIRAVVLIALGLLLSLWGSGVIVILDYYGFFFLLALPMLFLRRGVLLSVSISLAALGPFLITAFMWLVDGVTIPMVLQQFVIWTFAGQYPAVIWMPYILFGLWMQRAGLLVATKMLRLAIIALIVGIGCAAVVPLMSLTPEVPSALSGISAGAFGAALIWVLVVVLRRPAGGARKLVALTTSIGSMPLSIYVLHVLVISLIVEVSGISKLQSWSSFWIVAVLCVVFACTWRILLGRGPIEQLTRWMTTQSQGIPATFAK
ncbi:acyltransferase family protein [Microbacterium sp. NPDC058389]|uniref:acyltransferase family protein n=1 Tax=Microbacterium sp. NPDC058389 TaxID=3346475 RepID=UPI003657F84D